MKGLFDKDKLLADLKANNNPVPGFDRFTAMSIDVLSLDEVKAQVELDSSLSFTDKAMAVEVVDHIS